MSRLQDKKDNRGFSLVELIIVIVIMAILVGIVGTQVLPYVQRAQQAKDIQKVSAYCTDAMTAYMSCADKLDETEVYTITAVKGDSGWTVEAEDSSGIKNTILKDEFLEMNHLDTNAPSFLSKEAKKINEITIVCRHAQPSVCLTVVGPENPDAFATDAK